MKFNANFVVIFNTYQIELFDGMETFLLLLLLLSSSYLQRVKDTVYREKEEKQKTVINIINKGWQCKAGRERLTPNQSEDPSSTEWTTIPTHRIKEAQKKLNNLVEDKKEAIK